MMSLFRRVLPVIFSPANCIVHPADEPLPELPPQFMAQYAAPAGVQQFQQVQGAQGFAVVQQQVPAYVQQAAQQAALNLGRLRIVDQSESSDQSMPLGGLSPDGRVLLQAHDGALAQALVPRMS